MTQIANAEGAPPRYLLTVTDVIRDFNGSPHRMIKFEISGDHFPVRSVQTFVRIRNREHIQSAFFVHTPADEQHIIAFFPIDFNASGNVEFGYGNEVMAIFTNIAWNRIQRLDDSLVDADVITITEAWLSREKAANR